ncbi:response regulator transcription factor [Dyella japonica]|uniref:LuxR family transcriptional regulator n=1 Tax=Dyella japonica DSM 16301 TaxID=1440762 RepID=A0A0G9GYN5_9GAMM|nr:response regulator transcription factor [Dyella japonica]KLD62064.1 LuxR family transcriptional regulator [Dyella japonica DSM 16301]
MRIVIADDHPVILMGLRLGLTGQSARFEIVGEARSGKELFSILASGPCDLLITDFSMVGEAEGEDGLDMLSALHESYPSLPVIVLSMLNNPALVQGMLACGVRAVVDKTSLTKELMIAINAVVAGRMYLSEFTKKQLLEHSAEGSRALSAREAEVVRLFVQGISVTEIAQRTGKSVRTISQQKRDAMRKLGIANDKDLYEYARSTGLV